MYSVVINYDFLPLSDEGAVRVMDGLNPFGGRLEIYMESKWGTVCDDHWDMPEMEVACTQLGFGPPAVPNSQSNPFQVTEGTGDIHMDDVSCTGLEDTLLECQFIEEHNCQHHEDVVVLCQKPGWNTLSFHKSLYIRNISWNLFDVDPKI